MKRTLLAPGTAVGKPDLVLVADQGAPRFLEGCKLEEETTFTGNLGVTNDEIY